MPTLNPPLAHTHGPPLVVHCPGSIKALILALNLHMSKQMITIKKLQILYFLPKMLHYGI